MKDELREKLTAYALGDLPENEAAELRAELDISLAAQTQLKEIEATLGVLQDALSADAGAPSTLSPDQHRELRAVLPRSRPAQIIHWFTVAHPELTKAAASLILCGLIVVVLIPRYTLIRSADSTPIDESGIRVHREIAPPREGPGFLAGASDLSIEVDAPETESAFYHLDATDGSGVVNVDADRVSPAFEDLSGDDSDVDGFDTFAEYNGRANRQEMDGGLAKSRTPLVDRDESYQREAKTLVHGGGGSAAAVPDISAGNTFFAQTGLDDGKKAPPPAGAAARARGLAREGLSAGLGSDVPEDAGALMPSETMFRYAEPQEEGQKAEKQIVGRGPVHVRSGAAAVSASRVAGDDYRGDELRPSVVTDPVATPVEESVPAPSGASRPAPVAPRTVSPAKAPSLGDVPVIGGLFRSRAGKASSDAPVTTVEVRKKKPRPGLGEDIVFGQNARVPGASDDGDGYVDANENTKGRKWDRGAATAPGWNGTRADGRDVSKLTSETESRWHVVNGAALSPDNMPSGGAEKERGEASDRGRPVDVSGMTVSDYEGASDTSVDRLTLAAGERASRSLKVNADPQAVNDVRKHDELTKTSSGKDLVMVSEKLAAGKGGMTGDFDNREGEEDELEIVAALDAESDDMFERESGRRSKNRDKDGGKRLLAEASATDLQVAAGVSSRVEEPAIDSGVSVRYYDVNGVVLDELAKIADARKPQDAGAGEYVSTYDSAPGSGEADTKEVLERLGIEFGAGSSVTYDADRGRLMVANNREELGRVANELDRVVTELEARVDPTVFKAHGVNPVLVTKHQPVSTFSIDVDTASYTLSRRYMQGGTLPPAEAVRTEEFVNFFDYDYAAPLSKTFAVYAEVAPSEFGQGMHVLKLGVKGKRLGREEQRPAVLTLVIDTSGSMNTPDRLGLARTSLRLLIDRLAPTDQVAIVQYGSSARLLLDHTPASEKQTILTALERMQTSGSTNLDEGLRLGYQVAARSFVSKGENRVILMSDGVANVGPVEADEMLRNVETHRKQGIKCSVFGFGVGTYNDANLERLADSGDGVYAFVDSIDEAKRLFVDDLSATLNTIASDVKIQVEFNPKRVRSYRQLGYENRQLTEKQFRDDTVDAGEVGSGQSVTALYELTLEDVRREPIGVARVRFRNTDTGFVEELALPIRAQRIPDTFAQASPRFRLATCVAEFAEILRGSPYADSGDVSEVARVLRGVRGELNLDRRVEELTRLVSAAEGMPRAHQ